MGASRVAWQFGTAVNPPPPPPLLLLHACFVSFRLPQSGKQPGDGVCLHVQYAAAVPHGAFATVHFVPAGFAGSQQLLTGIMEQMPAIFVFVL